MQLRSFLHGLVLGGLAAAAMAVAEPGRAGPATPLPVELFFGNPAVSGGTVSPDGRYYAFLAPMKDRMGIGLMEADTGKTDILVRADVDIQWFFWKGDRVVFGSDVGGNESSAVRVIDVKTRKVTALLESIGRNNENRAHGNFGGIAFGWRAKPGKLLIFGTPEPGAWYGGLFEVDLRTNRRTALPAPGDGKDQILGFEFDHDAEVRARLRVADDKVVFEYRGKGRGKYKAVSTYPLDIHLPVEFVGILADNRTLLVLNYAGFDHGALQPFDLDTGSLGASLFEAKEGAIVDVELTRDRQAVAGVRTFGDKPKSHWFVKEYADIQAAVDGVFPDTDNRIVDVSDDGKRWVILSRSDCEPGVYSALDITTAKPRLMPLGGMRPDLASSQLRPMRPVHFAARDGLTIPAYLTLPAIEPAKNLPMVMMVHGGPYGVRDYWRFDPEVQFLASRGYAVLQVNYRGSGGYGRAFLEAGRLEWGAKMQDDLTDAVKWAIEQGIADPRRVCIAGASYGGYAALAGVAYTPDLYRCAVNYVGVSDLAMLVRWGSGRSRIMGRAFFDKWVHPDPAVLKARSPVNFVEHIGVPTFHAYGENDPRVDIKHWLALKGQLDRFGKKYEFLGNANEGHGFRKAANSIALYRAIEEFLARNLAPMNKGVVMLGDPKVLEMPAVEKK